MSRMLGNLPSVSELLESPPLKSLVNRVSRNTVVTGVRRFLDDMRTHVQTAAASVHVPAPSELAQRIADWISAEQPPSIVPVINATGLIINGELGGIPLADEAIHAIAALTRGYASARLDLATNEPCDAVRDVEQLLTRLTGAEAATLVNSPAAAIQISLAAIAGQREVIVSRGQLIESEDGFRLQDAIVLSGAAAREVGTANKTRLDDYPAAITPQTAALLRAQPRGSGGIAGSGPSEGQATPSCADLVALGRRNNIPVIQWLEAAALMDLSAYGLCGLPQLSDPVREGADLVICSGDRMLGGPACGIVLGRRALIEQIKNHPQISAFRADRLTLAAMAATLRLYQDAELAERAVPLISLIATPLENLRQRAERLAPQLVATGVAAVEIIAGQTFLTSAAIPGEALPSVSLALSPNSTSAEQLASALRTGTPAIVGRVEAGILHLDLRSVHPREDVALVAAIEAQRIPAQRLPDAAPSPSA